MTGDLSKSCDTENNSPRLPADPPGVAPPAVLVVVGDTHERNLRLLERTRELLAGSRDIVVLDSLGHLEDIEPLDLRKVQLDPASVLTGQMLEAIQNMEAQVILPEPAPKYHHINEEPWRRTRKRARPGRKHGRR